MNRIRRPSLRRRLELTLVGVALVSVLLLSGLNYLFARLLVTDSVEEQLNALRDTRVQAIEDGAERVQASVSTIALTPSVISAVEEFSSAFADIDEVIPPAQSAQLAAAYDAALDPLRAEGVEIDTEAVLPQSAAGQYVQYEYLVENPEDFDQRDLLDDAGDGSGYSDVHAAFHPLLRSLAANAGMSDLLLVDADSLDVVYSVQKHGDIGTNVVDGPWADGSLGEVVDQLADVAVGDTVISDSTFYVPARGESVIFLASAVRSGSDIVGAVVAELPVSTLTELVTGGADWELLGLGDTGEIYVVGADATLRTDTRTWLEDPELFLEGYVDQGGDEDGADQIRRLGSAALLQPVDNEAVQVALAGDEFLGTVTNYHGVRTFAASAPVSVGDQNWVLVVEQSRSEAMAGLRSLLRGTLFVMAILLPVTALLGWWLARTLTRPFDTLVQSSARIARGEPATGLEDLGNNEIGDVGRQLEAVARTLEAEKATIAAEEQRIIDVLGAVMPPRLVDRVRRGERDISDMVDTATVIAIAVRGMPEATGSAQDTVLEIAEQLDSELGELMHRYGVERVRRSSTGGLLVAGLGSPDPRIPDAARFAAEMLPVVVATGAEFGHSLTLHIGLAAGDVASGVLGRSQLTFSVWGEPVTSAFTLASLAAAGEVLVDANVVDGLDSAWTIDRRDELPGLDDDVSAFAIRPLEPDRSIR